MQDGKEIKPARLAGGGKEFAPLIAQLRQKIAEGQIGAYFNGDGVLPSVADVILIAGAPAEVTISPILPDSADELKGDTPPFLHIAVNFFNEDYVRSMATQFLLEEASLRTEPSERSDRASQPILNKAGRIIAFYQWAPDRPGHRMLVETVPILGGALVVALIFILLLLVRLWRYSAAIESGRAEAQHRAFHDALTGLPNRAHFEASLAKALAKRAEGGQGFAMMMLDLDRFKQINDTLGHPAGDELISIVGKRLQAALAPFGFVARLGGDEFGIIDMEISDESQVKALTSRLIEVIGKPFDLSGNEASVGVSIGIVIASGDTASGAEIVREADIALYEAKAGGRNRAVIYRESMGENVQQRHELEADLREALRHTNQVSVLFEPVLDAASDAIIGAEALPRWVHPRHGEVDRSVFLAIAEGSGLMETLGDKLLRRAAWVGARRPGTIISMAVSPSQLRSQKFFNRVFDILADTGMRPAHLEMLVPPGILTMSEDAAVETLRKFHATGIRVTADDFGAGESALTFLKTGYITRVRMAPAEIGGHEAGLAIFRAVGNLMHTMDIELAAKAIATTEQVAMMTEIGCSSIQGPAVARLVGAETLEDLLQNAPASPLAHRLDVA
jgi:diguanylate cyclase (GGDEF)-like protein